MQPDILKGISVVLAEPKLSLRKEFLVELESLGGTDIIETGNLSGVLKAFEKGGVDVLIGNINLPEGDLSEVVRDVRNGVVGDNPFIIAMLQISESDTGRVREIIDSGADDIQTRPVANIDLRNRIIALSSSRKRFVVTSSYIGPDRRTRSGAIPGTVEVPLIKVPNPLQLRVSGRLGDLATKRAIATAIIVVNEQKIERHAHTVNWLMQRIVQMQNGELPLDALNMKDQFNHLHSIAEDIVARLDGTAYLHAAELCLTLENMCEILVKSPELAGEEEMRLLSGLTNAIKLKCNGEYVDAYFSGHEIDIPEVEATASPNATVPEFAGEVAII